MSSTSKTSRSAKTYAHKARPKDVSNVYFNYDNATRLMQAGKLDPQDLLQLERFISKAKQDNEGRWYSPTFYDRETYGREIARIGNDDRNVLRWTGTSMKSSIRNLLYGNLYADVDFVNCHPVITLRLFKYFNMPCDMTEEYVDNRELVLQDLIQRAGGEAYLNRFEAKELPLRIFYGGKVETWCKDHGTLIDNYEEYQELKKEVRSNIVSILNNRTLQFLGIIPHDILQWAEGRRDSEKDTRDKYSKAWAYFCQEIERRCLDVLVRTAVRDGFIIGSKIYDGVHLTKHGRTPSELKTEIETLISGWCVAIRNETGIIMGITVKDMEQDLSLLEIGEEPTPELHPVINDAYAADLFFKLLGNKVKKHCGTMYLFDETTGLWIQNDPKDKILFSAAKRYQKELHIQEVLVDKDGKQVVRKHDYGGSASKTRSMLCYTGGLVQETYFLHNLDSSKGKLLWADGIYDFATDTFTPGFDPDIIFINRINRSYPKERVSQDLIDYVRTLLFVKPFDTMKEDRSNSVLVGKYLLESVARSIYGDYYCKKFNFCIGDANSGKGLLVDALKACFNTYVADYNGNNLLYNQQTCDEAKKNAWIADLLGKRIAFCNEVKFGTPCAFSNGLPPRIDANLLKKLASGGDMIDVRKNYQDQTEMANRCLMFFMCNDIPDIYPQNDSGVAERVRCVSYYRQFKDKSECVLKNGVIDETSGISLKDDSVKEKIKNSVEMQNALWFLIKDTVKSILQDDNSTRVEEPEAVRKLTKEYVTQGNVSFKECVRKFVRITNNKGDFMTSESIYRKVNDEMTMSTTKFGKEMIKLLPSGWSDQEKRKQKKINGKPIWCYFGVAPVQGDDDFSSSTDTENDTE